MVGGAFGSSAIVAGIVDVFIDLRDLALVDASSYQGSADDTFLHLG